MIVCVCVWTVSGVRLYKLKQLIFVCLHKNKHECKISHTHSWHTLTLKINICSLKKYFVCYKKVMSIHSYSQLESSLSLYTVFWTTFYTSDLQFMKKNAQLKDACNVYKTSWCLCSYNFLKVSFPQCIIHGFINIEFPLSLMSPLISMWSGAFCNNIAECLGWYRSQGSYSQYLTLQHKLRRKRLKTDYTGISLMKSRAPTCIADPLHLQTSRACDICAESLVDLKFVWFFCKSPANNKIISPSTSYATIF